MFHIVLVIILVLVNATTPVILQTRSKEEWIQLKKTANQECTKQFEITDGNLTEFFESSTDDKQKCDLIICFNERLFGKFHGMQELHDKVEAFISDFSQNNEDMKTQMLEAYSQCKDLTGANDCDTMLQVNICSMVQAAAAGPKLKKEIEELIKVEN